jgi:hypothetical protein
MICPYSSVIPVFLLSSIVDSFLVPSSPSSLGTISNLRYKKIHLHPPKYKVPTKLSLFNDSVSIGNDRTASSFQTGGVNNPVLNFTSCPIRVYIEDTDAYGIVYNTNYLRIFDRALFAETLTGSHSTELKSILGSDWSVVAVGNQKFLASPVLGSEVVVWGQLIIMKNYFDATNNDDSNQSRWSVWNMQMRSIDGTKIYNVVTDLVIASSFVMKNVSQWKDMLPEWALMDDGTEHDHEELKEEEESAKMDVSHHDTFRIQRDELDVHVPGQLPLRNILSYFERGRTNIFGGPNNLKRMQQQDGILAVVTSVRGLSLVWRYIDGHWRPLSIMAGDEVDVTSMVEVKRKVTKKFV